LRCIPRFGGIGEDSRQKRAGKIAFCLSALSTKQQNYHAKGGCCAWAQNKWDESFIKEIDEHHRFYFAEGSSWVVS